MAYKVFQWPTGGVGVQLLRETINNPDLELVGVKVFTPSRHGRDAGEIVGLPHTGVTATMDLDDILALDADVVLHAPLASDMNDVDIAVCEALRSGKNVISTAGYHGPQSRGAAVVDRLEAACRDGQATLHGSGIEPGFVFDRVAPTLTSMCLELDHLKMVEAANGAQHPEKSLIIDALGMGKALDEMTIETRFGAYFSNFFGEVLAGVAHTLNLEIQRVDRGLDVLPATRDLQIASGFVAKGTVALTKLSIGSPASSKAGRSYVSRSTGSLRRAWTACRSPRGQLPVDDRDRGKAFRPDQNRPAADSAWRG